jgi:hypothetical protein
MITLKCRFIVYLSLAKSLGAAHWVVQCIRWKTINPSSAIPFRNVTRGDLTLLNAVLLGSLSVLVVSGGGNTLNALVEVVLGGRASSGLLALWNAMN